MDNNSNNNSNNTDIADQDQDQDNPNVSRIGRMGRPKKRRPKEVTDIHHVPQEEHYIGVKDKFLPFSSSIRADLYLSLKRAEFHEDVTITELINEAVEKLMENRPSTEKPLPDEEAAKMKPLITNKYYYWKKIAETEGR